MSPDSTDDNLEAVRIEWLRRLQRREIPLDEAQAALPGMKARLEFLRNLHSSIANHADFAAEARDVEQEIQNQADEIRVVEAYVENSNGGG